MVAPADWLVSLLQIQPNWVGWRKEKSHHQYETVLLAKELGAWQTHQVLPTSRLTAWEEPPTPLQSTSPTLIAEATSITEVVKVDTTETLAEQMCHLQADMKSLRCEFELQERRCFVHHATLAITVNKKAERLERVIAVVNHDNRTLREVIAVVNQLHTFAHKDLDDSLNIVDEKAQVWDHCSRIFLLRGIKCEDDRVKVEEQLRILDKEI
jgi:hypothetical protein